MPRVFLTYRLVTFSPTLFRWCFLMSLRAPWAVASTGDPCWFPVVFLLLYKTKIIAFCLSVCAIHLGQGGMWCETESCAPACAPRTEHWFHGSWQWWGHFPLPLRNKIKLQKKRHLCCFCGCCAQTLSKRKAGDVLLIFQCAGGSGMFSALLEREQMFHNCNRKSGMLLYITDFGQHFGNDRWPKQMWKGESGIWSMSASWIFKIWFTVWQKHYSWGFCSAGFYIHPWLFGQLV